MHRRILGPVYNNEKENWSILTNKEIYASVKKPTIGLEVSVYKTKYMVMSQDQNAGRIHSVRIDNSTFERVEEFNFDKSKFYCGRN